MFRDQAFQSHAGQPERLEAGLHVGKSTLERTAVVARRFGFPSPRAFRAWAYRHAHLLAAVGGGRYYDVRDVETALRKSHRSSSSGSTVARRQQ